MKKSIKFTIITAIIFTLLFLIYSNRYFFRPYFNQDLTYQIKKYLLPYKLIGQLEKKVTINEEIISAILPTVSYKDELEFKKSLSNVNFNSIEATKLNGKYKLTKYKFLSGFLTGIHNVFPGSGYLHIFKNKLFILSSRGILAYSDLKDSQFDFYQIKNNINKHIGNKQYTKSSQEYYNWFSLKDLFIQNDVIYISYTQEVTNNCWNTGVIAAPLNYETLNFKKVFSPNECVKRSNKEFDAHESGGRIIGLDDNNIILSIGEYRDRLLAQEEKSVNGKIIKINLLDRTHRVLSMGHRNPQGLLYDSNRNIILSTEHGPDGGDEINLINLNSSLENVPNYGWPFASYGRHYGYVDQMVLSKLPLPRSHTENGFIKPLKYFVPSIGISEIVKINKDFYVHASLNFKSLYFFKLNNDLKITEFDQLNIGERIRDIFFYEEKLYLFLEDTASVGVLEF